MSIFNTVHNQITLVRMPSLARIIPTNDCIAAKETNHSRLVLTDVETTGLSFRSEIIQIAMREIYVNGADEIVYLGRSYVGYQQPREPISQDIEELTGVTNARVAGHSLDRMRIESLLSEAQMTIAHNAAFDRPFVDAATDARGPWACSFREIPWRTRFGVTDAKLHTLLVEVCGMFARAHDAMTDVDMLAVVLNAKDDTGKTAMSHLLERAYQPSVRLWVRNTPYESRHWFKEQGAYRWFGGNGHLEKGWFCDCTNDELADVGTAARAALPAARFSTQKFTARERYTRQHGLND